LVCSVGGFLGGILLGKGRIFRANLLIFYGASFKMIGDGLFSTITPNRFILALASGFIAMFGIGILMIASIVVTQLSCADKHIGLATLVLGSVRSIGGSLAVTIFSQVMHITVKEDAGTRIPTSIAEYNVPASSIPGLIKSMIGGRPKEALKLEGVTPEVLQAALLAIKWSWTTAFK
jgi:hypothetical protein